MKYLLLISLFASTAYADPSMYDWCESVGGKKNVVYSFEQNEEIQQYKADCVYGEYIVEIVENERWMLGIRLANEIARQNNMKPGVVLVFDKPPKLAQLQNIMNTTINMDLKIRVWLTYKGK